MSTEKEQDDFFVTTEEILKTIENAEKNIEDLPKIKLKKDKENKDVLNFIKKNGILPGDTRVPTYAIYYHYSIWTRTNWARLWGKEEFFRTFRKHFTQVRTGRQRYYLLNDALDLSDELIKKAKKYDERKKRRAL